MERRGFCRVLASLGLWALAARTLPKVPAGESEDWLGVPLQRNPVESTNLRSVGYQRAGRVLEIEFRSGNIYRYRDVPLSAFEALMKAESKGRFFAQRIRGQYEFRRMDYPRR